MSEAQTTPGVIQTHLYRGHTIVGLNESPNQDNDPWRESAADANIAVTAEGVTDALLEIKSTEAVRERFEARKAQEGKKVYILPAQLMPPGQSARSKSQPRFATAEQAIAHMLAHFPDKMREHQLQHGDQMQPDAMIEDVPITAADFVGGKQDGYAMDSSPAWRDHVAVKMKGLEGDGQSSDETTKNMTQLIESDFAQHPADLKNVGDAALKAMAIDAFSYSKISLLRAVRAEAKARGIQLMV